MLEIEKILLLEDDYEDAVLLERQLRNGNIWAELFVCDNESDFKNVLDNKNPNIILSDYDVPGFSGFEAFKLCKTFYPEIPFVFITGTVTPDLVEETVITSADAYLLKDNLSFLADTINTLWFKRKNNMRLDFSKHKLDELEAKINSLSERMEFHLKRNKALISGNKFISYPTDFDEESSFEDK